MARTKLTDKQKKKIIADYVENQNYSETARMNNVSDVTVKDIVSKDKSTLKKFEQKKEENTQSTIEYMQTQHETKKRILDKILVAIEEKADNVDMFTNIKDLATAYGIIIDKELKVLELKNKDDDNKDIQTAKDIIVEIRKVANNENRDK